MSEWQAFEKECLDYLNSTYGRQDLVFIDRGLYNSFLCDIEVEREKLTLFFIETKMSKAQSGQFSLGLDQHSFFYSEKNANPLNFASERILSHLNSHFHHYKNVDTRSLVINLPETLFSQWIQEHYLKKECRYIITRYKENYIIFPLSRYLAYFDIHANLRVKRSGSRAFSIIHKGDFEMGCTLGNLVEIEGKFYLESRACFDRFKIEGMRYNYQLKHYKNNLYSIRVLSNTASPTVVFSIALKQRSQLDSDLAQFISDIKSEPRFY